MLKPIVVANRIEAKLGKDWHAESRMSGDAEVVGPDGARILIRAASIGTLQIACKALNPIDEDISFTALRAWPPERVVATLIGDYLPAYLQSLADRIEERADAKDWAVREREQLEEIGRSLSVEAQTRIEGNPDEPLILHGFFDLGSSGDVAVVVHHRGSVTVRMNVHNTDMLSVLIPVMVTYNKERVRTEYPASERRADAADMQEPMFAGA